MGWVILTEFIVAFLIAAVLSTFYAWVTKKKRRGIGFFGFFLIVLMATWAGGIWMQPSGTATGQINWWPFIIVGITFALLIAVFGPRSPPEGRQETLEKLDEMAGGKALEELTYTVLKLIFWFVFAMMAVAILFRYATRI